MKIVGSNLPVMILEKLAHNQSFGILSIITFFKEK